MSPDRDRDELSAIYRRVAPSYDRLTGLVGLPFRRHAVGLLGLQPRDIVLDVACGTGLAFPLIEDRIGPEGRLVGIDVSAEMLSKARRRAERHRWANITLIESRVEDAAIPVMADAALCSLAPHVLASSDALDNVLRHLQTGGRVAVFCPKQPPRWALPVWLYVWWATPRFGGTLDLLDRPWRPLAGKLNDLRVRSTALGAGFFAWGTVTG